MSNAANQCIAKMEKEVKRKVWRNLADLITGFVGSFGGGDEKAQKREKGKTKSQLRRL